MSKRPIASLSLDLDNKWAYLRAAGRDDWQQSSSILPVAIDRIVDVLGSLNLPLTVFLVGRDLEVEQDVIAIERFGQLRQWEPANHSWNHLPWMHTMESGEAEDEILITQQRIVEVLGRRPLGFRGPGFSCPDSVLDILLRQGYRYDASVFPTSVAPLARWFFLMKTDLKGEQREKAKQLYGGFRSLLQPNRPFVRSHRGDAIWEVPVTVMPLTRLPIHMSYLTYLASFSVPAAKAYFTLALRLAAWTGTAPSFLLHPPDFMGREDDEDLSYMPGMAMKRSAKLSFVRWALHHYQQTFDVRVMIDQLRRIDPQIDPDEAVLTTPASHITTKATPYAGSEST